MGRTLNIKNKKDETVAFAAKSTKALIMTQVRTSAPMEPQIHPVASRSVFHADMWRACSDAESVDNAEQGVLPSRGDHRLGHMQLETRAPVKNQSRSVGREATVHARVETS